MAYAILAVQSIQIMFAKLSIVFFYRRVFYSTKGNSIMSIATLILIALSIGWGIAFFFANIFECRTAWGEDWGATETLNTACINETAMNEGFFFSDFIIDFFIFVLPMYKVCIHSPLS